MKPAHSTPRVREELERKFKRWTRASRDKPPPRGWIREIREALGMSSGQLAKMLGVSRAAVTALEKAEMNGTAKMATLRKAAGALGCTMVYAILPKESLHDIMRRRAYGIVMPHVVLLAREEKMKMSVEVMNAMIWGLVKKRGLLEKPKLLWNQPELPKEYFKIPVKK